MNSSGTALTRDSNGKICLGYGIHSRAEHGDVKRKLVGQTSLQTNVRRKNVALRGNKKHVVKGKTFLNKF